MIDINKMPSQRITDKYGRTVITCPNCGGNGIDIVAYNFVGRRILCSVCYGACGVAIGPKSSPPTPLSGEKEEK